MIDIHYSSMTPTKLDLRLYKAEYVLLDQRWRAEQVKSPFTRLYFVKEGHGYLKTDDAVIELLPNRVYLIPAECDFAYSCTTLEKLFFHLSVITFEGYDLLSPLGKIYELPYAPEEWEELARCVASDSYYDALRLKLRLLRVLVQMKETFSFQEQRRGEYSPLITEVLCYVQEHASVSLKVTELSKQYFVSESKLRNLFLKEMGLPIGKYIDDMVFLRAKQLLADRSLAISQISARLGFCDQFYFSRRFKEKFGRTPSSFRKNIS